MIERNPLPFAIGEYEERLNKVRRRMTAAGVEAMLTTVPENIVYLTGYHTLGYFTYQILIVSLDHAPILLTRAMNTEKGQADSCLQNIEGYKDTESPDDATYRVLETYGLLNKRLGNQDDAWFFSVARYKKLIGRLGIDDLIDCSGLVEEVRKIKSPKEIEYIREAGRYCAASLDSAIAATGPGVLECVVNAAAHDGMHRAGSEYLGHSAQFVSSPQSGLGFECAERRPILRDGAVYMEAGGTHNRYNCMLSRTVLVGNPDPKFEDMAMASRDGLNAAMAATKAGVTSHEVDKAARDVIAKAGFADAFAHRTGYSIGIGFPPDWGEGRIMSINENDPLVLEPNMCFHYIPDLKYGGFGGAVFSESLVVTETGYEPLSKYSQEIFRK
jgi:Xaa-Pro dipeptidase